MNNIKRYGMVFMLGAACMLLSPTMPAFSMHVPALVVRAESSVSQLIPIWKHGRWDQTYWNSPRPPYITTMTVKGNNFHRPMVYGSRWLFMTQSFDVQWTANCTDADPAPGNKSPFAFQVVDSQQNFAQVTGKDAAAGGIQLSARASGLRSGVVHVSAAGGPYFWINIQTACKRWSITF